MTPIELRQACASFVCALWLAGAAWAQQGPVAPFLLDRDAAVAETRRCLAAAADPQRCLGHVTRLCLRHPAADAPIGRASCAASEHAAWDHLLNEFYRRTRSLLDAGQAERLRAAQLAWIEFRDKACAAWPATDRAGPFARDQAPACLRDLTGRRALDLRRLLERARRG